MRPKKSISPRQRMALQHFAVATLEILADTGRWDAEGDIAEAARDNGLLTGNPDTGYVPLAWCRRLINGRMT